MRWLIVVLVTLSSLLPSLALARTPTPTPSVDDYPPVIQGLIEEDSSRQCDEIGWAVSFTKMVNQQETITPDQMVTLPACHESGATFLVTCLEADVLADEAKHGPKDDEMWVLCLMWVVNYGSADFWVDPSFFELVDLDDERYTWTDDLFETAPKYKPDSTTVAPGGNHPMFVGFSIPDDTEFPLRVEISPIAAKFPMTKDDGPPLVVIVPELEKMSEADLDI